MFMTGMKARSVLASNSTLLDKEYILTFVLLNSKALIGGKQYTLYHIFQLLNLKKALIFCDELGSASLFLGC